MFGPWLDEESDKMEKIKTKQIHQVLLLHLADENQDVPEFNYQNVGGDIWRAIPGDEWESWGLKGGYTI